MASLERINFNVDPHMLLEIVERDISVAEKAEPTKLYQSYKGQLKLAVYVNCGLLTIHVVEGRHMTSKDHSLCSTYVKMELLGDKSGRTRCKTRTNWETNQPLFDEKFSFELLEKDLKKRLLISVYNRDPNSRKELLGCMSFGVNPIQSEQKKVDGWYYLLAPEVGHYKHLQVAPVRTSNHSKDSSETSWWPETPCRREPRRQQADTLTLCVQRLGGSSGAVRSGGYGFSVMDGSSRVRVSRVDAGSAAELAGLRHDDVIIRIDGQCVMGANSNAIARIIKHTRHHVILDVQRLRREEPIPMEPTPIITLASSPRRPHPYCSTPMFNKPAALTSLSSSQFSMTTATPAKHHLQDMTFSECETPSLYRKMAPLSYSLSDITNVLAR